ncbi:hypothetical protein NLX83_09510 [Allokutzneria sp. A3M-2-11 16]|uniref:hypothetical protein n=1 Tax=Allokutzneria sp. A3M-2-11 16 TaxID=2962043 RepID=UPI0020B763DB|nr:hypothetical protein [Allokutzneria sp. A3M-2-11 16]MCP3799493.1 hypothetical protein [Allokutzneria sp. A3M-2-11 16]
MTGNERRSRTPDGPPWSVDLLADLHAGVLDVDVAAELRPRVERDPEARAVLAALDATTADLAALPPVTMPPEVSARIEAAIQQEVRAAMANVGLQVSAPGPAPRGNVVSLDHARRRRRKQLGWGGGVLAAAAAVFGIVVMTLPGNTTAGTPQAQPGVTPSSSAPGPGDGPLTLKDSDLATVPPGVTGASDLGPLSDKAKLSACLQANGYPATTVPLGARQVTLDGKQGVLLILGDPAMVGRQRLLVVGPNCSAGNPDKLAEKTVGR